MAVEVEPRRWIRVWRVASGKARQRTSRHFSPPRIPVSQSWTIATRRRPCKLRRCVGVPARVLASMPAAPWISVQNERTPARPRIGGRAGAGKGNRSGRIGQGQRYLGGASGVDFGLGLDSAGGAAVFVVGLGAAFSG